MPTTPTEIAVVIFCALFAGISKSGFAGSVGILATPLLAITLNARFALGLLLPLLLAADIFNFYHFWKQWSRPALQMVVPGCIFGVLLGWPVLNFINRLEGSKDIMGAAIGIIAITFGSFRLYRELKDTTPTPFRPTKGHGIIAGTATGFISTLAHQGGVIPQMYLLPQKLDATTFVGTTTVIYFFTNLTKVPIFFAEGLLNPDTLRWAAYNIPLVFIGTAIGTYLNRRISSKLFNRILIVFVLLTGLKLIARAWN